AHRSVGNRFARPVPTGHLSSVERTPGNCMAEDASSGCFDSSSLAFASLRLASMTVLLGSSFPQAQRCPRAVAIPSNMMYNTLAQQWICGSIGLRAKAFDGRGRACAANGL